MVDTLKEPGGIGLAVFTEGDELFESMLADFCQRAGSSLARVRYLRERRCRQAVRDRAPSLCETRHRCSCQCRCCWLRFGAARGRGATTCIGWSRFSLVSFVAMAPAMDLSPSQSSQALDRGRACRPHRRLYIFRLNSGRLSTTATGSHTRSDVAVGINPGSAAFNTIGTSASRPNPVSVAPE